MSDDDIERAMSLVLRSNTAAMEKVAEIAAGKAYEVADINCEKRLAERDRKWKEAQDKDRDTFKEEMSSIRDNFFELATGYKWDDRKEFSDGVRFSAFLRKYWLVFLSGIAIAVATLIIRG
jgi:hypothetical protein